MKSVDKVSSILGDVMAIVKDLAVSVTSVAIALESRVGALEQQQPRSICTWAKHKKGVESSKVTQNQLCSIP